MKYALTALFLLLCVSAGWCQESRLPIEAARRYAKVCVEQAGAPGDAQIATEVDPKKACAEQGEGGGAMVIAGRKLSQQTLKKIGTGIQPLGQLWLRKWTLVVQEKPLPREQLRMVTVNVDDKDRPMALFLLGLRKQAKGLELVVYAKNSAPVQVLPLRDLGILQDLPLEIEWRRGEGQYDPLTLKILGQYQAVLTITRQGP